MAAVLAGCGTAAPEVSLTPIPDSETTAVLAGPLCEGRTFCECQQASGEAGLPTDSLDKRFEFKLGPVENELWVTVDGKVLYKDRERATNCFYVDLRAGVHPVVLRATGKAGFGARLSVSEQGDKGGYGTFSFACGGPGVCALTRLDEWQASLAKYKRNLFDPCGSTKVRNLQWKTGEAFDRRHPSELELAFELEIYEFDPEHAPGAPACKDRF